MTRWLVIMIGSSVGGSAGWYAGSVAGITTAYILSLFGAFGGWIAAIKIWKHYIG